MSLGKILLTTVSAISLFPVLPTMARAEEKVQIEEIIVTARKRVESIMKVPVSIVAIGQKKLEQYATGDLFRVADQVPGLILGEGLTGAGAQVSLRGVGTSATQNAFNDQSVSLNIDGMQMSHGLAYMAGMFDMAQIEVLKGPQALLYGKASPSGVISIRTADPTDKFEAILRGGYEFEAKEKQVELILSGPVTNTLKIRVAGQFSDSDGFFRNDAVAQTSVTIPGGTVPFPYPAITLPTGAKNPKYDHISNNQTVLLRATALWDPSDNFNARLKLNYSHSNTQGNGASGQLASCPDGTSTIFTISFIGGDNCRLDRNQKVVDLDPAAFPGISNGGVPFMKAEQYFGSMEMNYKIQEGLTLTSVTGYYHLDQPTMINGINSTSAATLLNVETTLKKKDFTEELRLTSNFADSPVNFMAGGFFQKGSMHYDLALIDNIDATPRLLFGIPSFITGPGIDTPILPPRILNGFHDVDIKTKSLFGQVLWKIAPQLELGAGVRWTKEDRDLTQTDMTANFNSGGIAPVVITHFPGIRSNTWAPEATLTYRPTDDLTVYGALKQAYKSGSYSASNMWAPTDNPSYGDERVRGGEVGIKGRLFDGQVAFNSSAYYNKFKGLQVGANLVNPDGSYSIRTLNAAAAKVYGIDFDVAYKPAEVKGLTLQGALNWNHARFVTFNNAQCWGGQTIAAGCNLLPDPSGVFHAQDVSGKPLSRAPEWAGNFGFNYEMPIANNMTMTIGSLTSYSASYRTNILARADMTQGSFFKTNANIALIGPNDRWELAVIGNNLTDKIVATDCSNANFQYSNAPGTVITGTNATGVGGTEELWCNADRGRSLWVRMSVKY